MKKKRGRPKKPVAKKPKTLEKTGEEAFLNFVGQNAQEKSAPDHANGNGLAANGNGLAANDNGIGVNDKGFAQFSSASDSGSSSSSSSGESDHEIQLGNISSDSDEPQIGKRVKRTATKRGGAKGRETSKKTVNAGVSSSKVLGSSSRKELPPPKNPAQDSRLNRKELKASLAVVQKIMEIDEAVPFNAPVDPVSQKLPDYFNVIDKPMDFGTICSNLQNGVKYMNSEDVYRDVEYIWDNCVKYNKKGDYIVYLMKRVKKKFMKYWKAAGLHSEKTKKPNVFSQFPPSSDHAMGYGRHDPLSTVDRLVNNPMHMQQNTFGTGHTQPLLPLSSYAQPYHYDQPQPSNSQVPQYSHFQAGVDSSYAGYSHLAGPPSNVHSMGRETQIPKRPVVPTANGTINSQQQPQSSSYHHWPPQPSQSHLGANFSNTGHPLPPLANCAMAHNGLASRSSVDPMFGMNQPQRHLRSHRQQGDLHQPRASIGQPLPSQPLDTVDISSADARRMGRRHKQMLPADPEPETPLTSSHSPPQLPSMGHDPPYTPQNTTRGSKRKVRGPTRCRFMSDVPDGERIFVPINELGQPVGVEASKLATFLGTVARDGRMAPLNFLDWSAIPDTIKEDMWQFALSKFDIDPLCKTWVMKSLASKWRNWKAKLKADHYTPHSTDEERLKDCNKRVLPDQWAALIAHWNSEQVQLRCAKNKANRAKQRSAHAAGSKSFARIREEERAKRSDGKDLTRGELYILTRTRKDGQPVNKGAAEIISKLREKATQKQQTSNDVDTYCQVMGEDRHDQVLDSTPSEHWGRKPSRNSLMRMALEAKKSANEEVSKMLSKMETMEQKCVSLEDQIAKMSSSMQTLINKMDALGSKQVPDNAVEDAQEDQVQSSTSSHALRSNKTGNRKK